jgi:uncharacterized protein YndB with AHSA1/START domain
MGFKDGQEDWRRPAKSDIERTIPRRRDWRVSSSRSTYQSNEQINGLTDLKTQKGINEMNQSRQSNQESSNTASYTKTQDIQASPRELYAAVTTVPGIKGWWSHDVVEKNGDITVRFSEKNFQTLRLLNLSPDKKVVWEWIAQYFPVEGTTQTDEWVGTRVSFDIQANRDGSSTLIFTHAGLTPQLACHGKCNAGWNHSLGSLKGYLEQGTGTPNSGPG